ncbi:MAG TPA: hypothetical protein VK826_19835 [Bacteroidia bacterium]|nr:hypothetical protein [Bacteroidia bacterium]
MSTTRSIVILILSLAMACGYSCDSANENDSAETRIDSIAMLHTKIDSLLKLIPDGIDTIVNDEFEVITHHPEGYVEVQRRFRPKKTFEDYPVRGRYSGMIPPLNFSTCAYGKKFRTRTKEGAELGPRFAGHYAFASWGCGAPCQGCSIIDLRTGNVYAGPDATGNYAFRIDSKILLVNPPDSNGLYYYPPMFATPEQYVWTGDSFKKLE